MRGLRVAPLHETAALERRLHADDLADVQRIGECLDGADELRPDEQHLRFAVVDDVCELARREAPVDRRDHRTSLRSAEHQLEIEVGILAEMRDPIARAHTERDQALRNLAGARVELLVSSGAPFERERRALRREARVNPRNIGQRVNALGRSFRRSRCLQSHRFPPVGQARA